MTTIDYKSLKKGGFMRQKQNNRFSLRLRIVGGNVTSAQVKKIYEIADKFGEGYVHLTSRQSLEISFIKYEDIEEVKLELTKAGLEPGACGPRVRTITACQGNHICLSGLIDTKEIAKEFDEKYYARELPRKFKLGIVGCGNNCLKAEENDIGVKGGMHPFYEEDKCTYCGLCEIVCPVKCIQVDKKEKTLAFQEENCINCGKCVKSCPTDAWIGKAGYIISFGGTFGNNIAVGKEILPIIFKKEDVHKIIEATFVFFKEHGNGKERFRGTLDRIGWDVFEKHIKESIA